MSSPLQVNPPFLGDAFIHTHTPGYWKIQLSVVIFSTQLIQASSKFSGKKITSTQRSYQSQHGLHAYLAG